MDDLRELIKNNPPKVVKSKELKQKEKLERIKEEQKEDNFNVVSGEERDGLSIVLKNYFRLNDYELTNTDRDMLNMVFDYVYEKADRNINNVSTAIDAIVHKLGFPGMGESKLTQVYRYVKLQQQAEDIQQQLQRI